MRLSHGYSHCSCLTSDRKSPPYTRRPACRDHASSPAERLVKLTQHRQVCHWFCGDEDRFVAPRRPRAVDRLRAVQKVWRGFDEAKDADVLEQMTSKQVAIWKSADMEKRVSCSAEARHLSCIKLAFHVPMCGAIRLRLLSVYDKMDRMECYQLEFLRAIRFFMHV